jgi:hypothetical protein
MTEPQQDQLRIMGITPLCKCFAASPARTESPLLQRFPASTDKNKSTSSSDRLENSIPSGYTNVATGLELSSVSTTGHPVLQGLFMGGTGLEPVTPSLSIRGDRSRPCAHVRLTRMAPRNPVAVFGPQRTRANVRCSHCSHAHSSGFVDRAAQRPSRTPRGA